jgi:uncharacterized protein YlaN (UPF0358 family)
MLADGLLALNAPAFEEIIDICMGLQKEINA